MTAASRSSADSSAPRTKLARRVALWPRRGSRYPAPNRRADDATVGADTQTRPRPRRQPTEEEVETSPKLSGLMVVELSAHRTVAMRLCLASDPQAAFLAATHALALNAFYGASSHSCLDLSERSVTLGSHAPGIGDSLAARTLFEFFGNWQMRLPADPADLWSWLLAQDESVRAELFALCVGLSVNALNMPWERRTGALEHADRLAEHSRSTCASIGAPPWRAYFGKVTKAHILAAVREAKGDETAEMIAHLKKADMAAEAERLLQGTGWLPEGLRTPNLDAPAPDRGSARARGRCFDRAGRRVAGLSRRVKPKVLTIPPPPNSRRASNAFPSSTSELAFTGGLFSYPEVSHVRLVSTLRL